jgi:hypothetical protein
MQKSLLIRLAVLGFLMGLKTPISAQTMQTIYYPADINQQIQNYCPTRVAPLLITIQNDTDVDLNIVAPKANQTYVHAESGQSESRTPTIITRNFNGNIISVVTPQQNNPAPEIPEVEDQQPLSERLCGQDIGAMEDQTLYAHAKYTFTIRRLSFPAHLYLKFRITAEEPYGDYEVARWEYSEEGGSADATCDIEASRLRYTIGCSGNNDITNPIMNINIGHVNRPIVPQLLINGAEPNVGPPSTP